MPVTAQAHTSVMPLTAIMVQLNAADATAQARNQNLAELVMVPVYAECAREIVLLLIKTVKQENVVCAMATENVTLPVVRADK